MSLSSLRIVESSNTHVHLLSLFGISVKLKIEILVLALAKIVWLYFWVPQCSVQSQLSEG